MTILSEVACEYADSRESSCSVCGRPSYRTRMVGFEEVCPLCETNYGKQIREEFDAKMNKHRSTCFAGQQLA